MNVVESAVATTRRAVPRCSAPHVGERQPGILGDHLAAGERREVAEVLDPAVAEPGRARRHGLERAVAVVRHQHPERASVDLLGQDHERPRVLHDEVERRQEVTRVGDRPRRHQHVWVVEHGLHAVLVAHHVWRHPAVLDHHALDEVDRDPRDVALLDRHDTLGADVRQRLRHRLADLLVLGRDRRDVAQRVTALDGPRAASQLGAHARDRFLDPASQQHRVGAVLEREHPLAHDRLREQRGRGGAVAGQVAGAVGDLAHQLRTHVLVLVAELDLAGDRDAVVRDDRRTREALEHDVAALGAQRDLDRVGELVDAGLQKLPRLMIEEQSLAHRGGLLGSRLRRGRGCRGPAAGLRRDPPWRR